MHPGSGDYEPGGRSPLFYYPVLLSVSAMIDSTKIENLVNEFISGTDIFLVEVKVSRENKITVYADTLKGIKLEQCADLSRYVEQNLSRDIEDYELEVSSPGIGKPFKVKEQYIKNIGNVVEVLRKSGEKFRGVLKDVKDSGFGISQTSVKKVKSAAGVTESNDLYFNFDDIKSVKEILIFK